MTGDSESGLPGFTRRFFGAEETLTTIGRGEVGGKAAGLRLASDVIEARGLARRFAGVHIVVPTLSVIASDAFDAFVAGSRALELLRAGADDRELAVALQQASLPTTLLGDLFALASEVRRPLAVRSSSLLEDALAHPFAGVYATKMTPNNQHDAAARFQRLSEAVKFVLASTFFANAVAYRAAIGKGVLDEKMAVILQEVVGHRHDGRFYPDVSAVARSVSFYPFGPARPEDGVLSLALGLGKTIVDGGRCWTYCPRYPHAPAPFGAVGDLLRETQTEFWAVNMGKPPAYDPIAEEEYLVRGSLADAEADGAIAPLASTYDARSDRLAPGIGAAGPRALTFAPLREHADWAFNEAVAALLEAFEDRLAEPVEIEMALTLEAEEARLNVLQVRPMAIAHEPVDVTLEDLTDPLAIVASPRVMGNGRHDGVTDVVFLRRDRFDRARTRAVAAEVEAFNRRLLAEARPYVLIGFGRWGSADPWLGVPVEWSQIAGARVIVEAGLPDVAVEPSQGSHFFHNMLGFGVTYFSIPSGGAARIDWEFLESLPSLAEGELVRHARLSSPLSVLVDGRSGRGVVRRAGDAR